MKNDKKPITKRVKSVGIVALAFFAGWLLSIPIKSFAAPDMVSSSLSVVNTHGLVTAATIFIVAISGIIFGSGKDVHFSISNFGQWLNKVNTGLLATFVIGWCFVTMVVLWLLSIPSKSLAVSDMPNSILIGVFNGTVTGSVLIAVFMLWQSNGYYVPRIDQWLRKAVIIWKNQPPLALIENRTMSTVSNPSQNTSTVGEDTTKNKGVLKLYIELENSYNRIQDTNEKAQKSNMSQKNKDYSNSLVKLSNEVLDKLQSISDLGQANAQEIIEKDGVKVYGEKTHKEKAEDKITEIEMALFILMSEHATNISNDIKSIKLPVSYEIENYLEEVRSEGERLLSLTNNSLTAISTEDEFVLEKIVNERLDELWNSYKHAKESYFERNAEALDLPEKTKVNPDNTIKEALANIQTIFKAIDTSIKSDNEGAAYDDLLITKRYFDTRK